MQPGPLRHLDSMPDPERAFVHIYGASSNAFWLDSSARGERGRFSFMGDSEGPLAAVVTYDVEAGEIRIERGGTVETRAESIFDYLGRELERLRPLTAQLPFDFDCGFAGYLGYELKAECDGAAAHRATTPDAAFVLADRLIAFDHQERHTYLLSLDRGRFLDRGDRTTACGAATARGAAGRCGAGSACPASLAPALSRRHRCLQALLNRGPQLRDMSDQHARGRERRRSARALPGAASRQPRSLLRLPALRRPRRAQLLA